MGVLMVKAQGEEPKLKKEIVKKQPFRIRIRIDTDKSPTTERMEKPLGAIRFFNNKNEAIAFALISNDNIILVYDPVLDDAEVSEITGIAESIIRYPFYRLVVMMAKLLSNQYPEVFGVDRDKIIICGNELRKDARIIEAKKIERCLAEKFNIHGVIGGEIFV